MEKNTIILTENDIKIMVNEVLIRYYNNCNESKFGKFLGAAALGTALAMGNPTPANAQLNVKNQVSQHPQKIMNLFYDDNILYKTENNGYVIDAETYFDGKKTGERITIVLGFNEKSALMTLKDLKDIITNNIDHITFEQEYLGNTELLQAGSYRGSGLMQGEGKGVTISKVKSLNPVVGDAFLYLSGIDKAIEYFNNTYYINDELFNLQDKYNQLRKEYYRLYYHIKTLDNKNEIEADKDAMNKTQIQMNDIEKKIQSMKSDSNTSMLKDIDSSKKQKKTFRDGIYN